MPPLPSWCTVVFFLRPIPSSFFLLLWFVSDFPPKQIWWQTLHSLNIHPFSQDVFIEHLCSSKVFPGGASGKESASLCRRCKRHRFDPWVGKSLWSRKWQPSQEFFPVKFHGQKILWGYSPWGLKESGLSDWTLLILCFNICWWWTREA